MMRAVDAIMECLKAEGVDVVFGYPGGANLPTYDALVDAGIRHVLVPPRGRAAATPPRATPRRPARSASCFATSGPGATNIVTPLTDAMMDSVPAGRLHRPGAHRPARHRRLPGGGHVRHHDADRQALVHDPAPAEIPRVVHEAFHIARTGPPGPGADRHAAGPHAARRSTTSRSSDVAPARLPADDRGQLEADPARRQGARQRAPAGDLRAAAAWSTPTRPTELTRARRRPTASRSPAR